MNLLQQLLDLVILPSMAFWSKLLKICAILINLTACKIKNWELTFLYSEVFKGDIAKLSTNTCSIYRYKINNFFRVYGMKRLEEMIAIPEVMFYPSQIRRKPFMDMILSTLTTESIQEVDASFPEAVWMKI